MLMKKKMVVVVVLVDSYKVDNGCCKTSCSRVMSMVLLDDYYHSVAWKINYEAAAAVAVEPATQETVVAAVVVVVVADLHIRIVDCWYHNNGQRTLEETAVVVVAALYHVVVVVAVAVVVVRMHPSVPTMVYPNWNDVCVVSFCGWVAALLLLWGSLFVDHSSTL
jgi:hypothetical protein